MRRVNDIFRYAQTHGAGFPLCATEVPMYGEYFHLMDDVSGVGPSGSLPRALALLRALAASGGEGMRLTNAAVTAGVTPASAHRLLRVLIDEGLVEQDARKHYRLGIEFFSIAARAGNPGNLREVCRPTLLRLSASLGDTVFLLVRSGYDAVCLDRCEGPVPIRSFTGDIGGKVILGVGQGSMAILAHLPEAEREEVIRFNLPRLLNFGPFDEVYFRKGIELVRESGYAARGTGLLPGMAGVAVAILDRERRPLAAISIGTTAERLNSERLPTVVQVLRREADALAPKINPFDAALRRPGQHAGSF
jgi:DNA-binding IclR family transcriptional regulator